MTTLPIPEPLAWLAACYALVSITVIVLLFIAWREAERQLTNALDRQDRVKKFTHFIAHGEDPP